VAKSPSKSVFTNSSRSFDMNQCKGVFLLVAMFAITSAATLHGAETETLDAAIDLWKIEFKSRDQLVLDTAGEIRSKAIQSHGSFDSYWQASATTREGKVFEAVVADNVNSVNRSVGRSTRLVPTAAIEAPTDAADLLIVDARGNKLGRIQAKLGFQDTVDALSDPKYADMDIVTCRETYESIGKELAEREAAAARRGIALPDKWQRAKDAMASNRLWKELPCGSPLPQRSFVAEIGKAVYRTRWTTRCVEMMKAGEPVVAATGRRADDVVKAAMTQSDDIAARARALGVADDIASPTRAAITQADDIAARAAATMTQSVQHLPSTTPPRAPLPTNEGGTPLTTPRVPAGAGAGSRTAVKRIAHKIAAEAGDDVAKATAMQTGGKLLASTAVPLAVAVEVGTKGYDSYKTEVRFSRGEITQNTREVEHARSAGGLAGSMGGGVAGGVVGAEVGTAVMPVFGTAVGAVVGAVGGAIAGEKAVAAASEAVVNSVHKTGTTVAEGATAAAKGVRDTWKWATGW
jgi:hypothetical protein